MIRPVASGRLFSVYGRSESSDFTSQEQQAIARLEETRRSMLAVQARLYRTRADSARFGESQGDPVQLESELRRSRQEYDSARAELAELRSGRKNSGDKRRKPASLQSYLEQRVFARDFPDDARRLKAYQTYDSRGGVTALSVSSLEFIGSTIDVRI